MRWPNIVFGIGKCPISRPSCTDMLPLYVLVCIVMLIQIERHSEGKEKEKSKASKKKEK